MIDDITTWYYGIRCVPAVILAVVFGVSFCKKMVKSGKRKVIAVFIASCTSFFIWFFGYIILTLLTVENLFLRFDTPQEAFRYHSNQNIIMVDEQEKYALVVANNRNGEGAMFYVLPKADERWKLNVRVAKRDFAWSPSKINVVCLESLRIPDSNDRYILCNDIYFNGNKVGSVSDNRNTEFQFCDVPSKNTVDFYYGLVKDINSGYEVYVDEQVIKFD